MAKATRKRPKKTRPAQPAIEPVLMRVSEAAQLANVGRTKGFEMVKAGIWPCVRLGKSTRIPRAALLQWIERHTSGGAA